MVMQYGHKKTRAITRDGLTRTYEPHARTPRAAEKVLLRRAFDGDEDVDAEVDLRSLRWERRTWCKRGFERWALHNTSGHGYTRLAQIGGLMSSPETRYFLTRQLRWRVMRDARRAWTPADAKAQHVARVARITRLLEAVVDAGDVCHLNKAIQHTPVVWSVWTRDAPTEVPDGVSRRKKIVLRDRYVDVPQGPTKPRKLKGRKDIPLFVSDLFAAARTDSVEVEPYLIRTVWPARHIYWNKEQHQHTYISESVNTTRRNPDYHPEWLSSVEEFLEEWVASSGASG